MKGDIRFETKTVYDQAALAVGQKVLEYRDPALRSSIRSARLLLGGFGGVIFGLGGMSLSWKLPMAVTVILMVIGIFIASLAVFYRQMLQFGSRKAITNDTETVRFTDEGFSLKSDHRDVEHPYSDLIGLYRRGHYLFLFVRLNVGYVVDERGLQKGTPEELLAFLEERTSKSFIQVR